MQLTGIEGMATIAPLDLDAVRAAQAAGSPFVVSYGLGLDSTAMLIGLAADGLRPDLILFADVAAGTGDTGEKTATMSYLETINAWLATVDFPQITVVSYQTTEKSRTDPRTGEPYKSLFGQCWATGNLPPFAYGGKAGGQASANCSIKWKQRPQELFLESWAPAIAAWTAGRKVIKAIGYDCAEMHRGGRARAYEAEAFDWTYPLRSWSWSRPQLSQVVADAGLPIPPKSSCVFCPAMRPAEFKDLARTEPASLLQVIALEDRACNSPAGKVTAKEPGLWMHKKQADEDHRNPDRTDGRWTSVRAWAEASGALAVAEAAVNETN